MLGAGAPGAGTAASPVLASGDSPAAGISAAGKSLTARQKIARNKALRKCNSKRTRARRKTCRHNVRKRFAPKPDKPVKVDPAAVIDVRDDYFSPDAVDLDRGDSILWVWNDLNHDPHDVNLIGAPDGVDRNDFRTANAPASDATFTRTFTVPGMYQFTCSLHFQMTMTVAVK